MPDVTSALGAPLISLEMKFWLHIERHADNDQLVSHVLVKWWWVEVQVEVVKGKFTNVLSVGKCWRVLPISNVTCSSTQVRNRLDAKNAANVSLYKHTSPPISAHTQVSDLTNVKCVGRDSHVQTA